MRNVRATPAVLTLTYLVPVSVWWFAQMSILLQASEPLLVPFSLNVLRTLSIVQVLSLCLFVPHWIQPQLGMTYGATAIATSLLPAWPLFAMLGLATGIPATALIATQAVAAGVGLAVAGIAMVVQRLRMSAEVLRLSQACLGLAAATLAWLLRSEWLQWLTQ
jgi:hypothetical protein